jgi:FkbM family methyltransferase
VINPEHLVDVARALSREGGVYVEAGANDGIRQSNTLLIEQKLGWKGILIEPSPSAFTELLINRPENHLVRAALVSCELAGKPVRGAFLDGQLTGTLDPHLFDRVIDRPRSKSASARLRFMRLIGVTPTPTMIEVPTITLEEALYGAGLDHIDLLSLDVEGFELQVLAGLDFERHSPRVIVIEVRRSDMWNIVQRLSLMGYALVENLSRFSESAPRTWSEDHEDFLFVLRRELAENASLRDVVLGVA